MAQGLVVDGKLVCPWHGAVFDLATGKSEGGPQFSDLATFQVVSDKDSVHLRVPVDKNSRS